MLVSTLGQQGRQHICYTNQIVLLHLLHLFQLLHLFICYHICYEPTSPHPAWVTSSGSGQFDCRCIIQLSSAWDVFLFHKTTRLLVLYPLPIPLPHPPTSFSKKASRPTKTIWSSSLFLVPSRNPARHRPGSDPGAPRSIGSRLWPRLQANLLFIELSWTKLILL